MNIKSDILYFFDEHMDALPIYEELESQILQRIPDAGIKVSKTQISFSMKHGFAFVSGLSFFLCDALKEGSL